MTTVYKYIVLRTSPDFIRGESMNIGVALFSMDSPPKVLFLAPLQKLKALDVSWSKAKISEWAVHVQDIVSKFNDPSKCALSLKGVGLCSNVMPGIFSADSKSAFDREMGLIKEMFIIPKGGIAKQPREKKTRLITELRKNFQKMHVMGKNIDDLHQHLIVQNVQIPGNPDLKADFVFKNGIYRMTQTFDYRVPPNAVHQKISEACTKTMAATIAEKEWGSDMLKLAVVNIPEEVADIADPHIDMLYANGFSIYHSNKDADLLEYYTKAVGIPPSRSFDLLPSPAT